MFDFIRNHSKAVMIVLFMLIVPSFILLGTGNNPISEKSPVVATVDGKDLRQSEWDAAHDNEARRLRAANPTLDPKLLDSPEAKYATLQRMVRDRVLAAAAEKSKLLTSDQRLAQELQQNPTIAALRRADGTLDMERYKQFAGSQGMTPEMLEARVRTDLSLQMVGQGIAGSGFATRSVADQSLAAFFEKREVRIARFNTVDYLKKVTPTDAELEQFYKDNPALFLAPEQARIEYIVLDMEAVKKNLTVSDQDLKTYYEQNAAKLAGKEERRASHILLAAGKDAPAADRQKAKAKAEELLAQVKKAPQTFADVAKRNSQDPGSAVAGGDLDFFPRGAMVKPFEDAAFAMKKGDISDVVESDFGYHIIQLTDIKAPAAKSFEEMKPALEAEFKKQQATAKYAEAAEAFTNGVYEQADNLKAVADRLKLEVKTADKVLRKPQPGATGALANANFLNALFSPDSVEKKRNTEALEVGPNQLVSGRLVQYTPARTVALAEVKELVRERVVQRQANELARKDGMAKLAAWQAAPASAVLPEVQVVSREQAQQLPPPLIRGVLRTDATKLPVLTGIDLGAAGYAVVSVDKVLPKAAVDETRARQELVQYTRWWTAAESLAYYDVLKERFKVKFLAAAPVAAPPDNAQ
jgi:peptidyl-prolyl cis-trans isomerase D